MMTLEEAIKHCKDVALSCTNKECALEHFQLLKWLQEYSNMLEKQEEQKPVEEYNITGIGSKNAQGKLGEMIKKLKPVNEVLEQNPAWSEEDEEKFRDVIRLIEQGAPVQSMRVHYNNWLRTLKDRVQPQPKQEWSEEDEEMIDSIIDYLRPMPIFFESTKGESGKEYTQEFIKNATKWLKSLRPQKQWKPSDEQMERLRGIINSLPHQEVLYSLYQDLKKLKA